ncbi:hypothetical protein H4219_002335 [Mycoemilia scoparia]|uniref:Uncharacterized protein n=1 Tax=Mycoemilia scoparia TaxID=417184 RepID=A0A9W8DUX5_9FUNG|nr:hypothetical protein H4219_002335 [Mycoemilia scoparia]
MSAFKLSAILQGHEKDANDHTLCSVSRDKTAKLWKRADKSSFEIEATFPHKDSVSSVTYLNPTDVTPKGLIVTGSGDKVIRIWDPEAPFQPISELRGHEDNVCTLYKGSSAIISGSWDKTARVWENNECIQVLKGHTQAVWAVMELSSDGSIITGSADKMIYRWKNGKIVQKFAGHTDCVRGLSLISSDQFASCGNDGAVMIWSLSSGQCVGVHHGHTSFVYSVSSIESNGEIASSGEDRAVRIWKGNGINDPF